MIIIQRACIMRRSLCVRPAALFPSLLSHPAFQRLYATEASRKDNSGPRFRTIFGLAIVGTLIFNEAAKSLDKNKPKNTFTEDEYENVMQGLKRRVAMFPNGFLDVKFSLSTDTSKLGKNLGEPTVYIDPKVVVEGYRHAEDDPYEPLLSEIYAKNGPDYLDKLPQGLLVNLLGRYMKDHCKEGDRVVLLNFPHTIKDAIKFENEITGVSKLLVPKESLESDVCKYYETVHKSRQI